jgi:hypothetical protein
MGTVSTSGKTPNNVKYRATGAFGGHGATNTQCCGGCIEVPKLSIQDLELHGAQVVLDVEGKRRLQSTPSVSMIILAVKTTSGILAIRGVQGVQGVQQSPSVILSYIKN